MAQQRLPAELLADLLATDTGSAHRQFHMVDALGRGAAHTGAQCIDWCGHTLRDGFSVAGNMLAGPQVIEATADSYAANAALPFAQRLLTALAAGEAAGGDKRGKQAAALQIQADEDWLQLDLRVDDHAEPITELQRLYLVSLQRSQPFMACLAGRHDPVGLTDRDQIEARIVRWQAERLDELSAGRAAEPGEAKR
jgi:uncharacterized Ntn-hydrolase superfamily protein